MGDECLAQSFRAVALILWIALSYACGGVQFSTLEVWCDILRFFHVLGGSLVCLLEGQRVGALTLRG